MSKYKVILIMLIVSHLVIADISEAARNLYHQCASESMDKNIIISPFSISSSMASLSMGAEGETFQEIFSGMHFNYNKTSTAKRFLSNFKALKKGRGKSYLSIVNQMYAQKGCKIKKSFRNITDKYFKSGIEILDFGDSENAANTINSFVANKTNNKIQNLIGPDTLDSYTSLVLINAIHFKGNWEHNFNEDETFQGDFYVCENETKSITFMKNAEKSFLFVELIEANAKAIQLSFKDSRLSFIAILPNDPDGLPALEEKIQKKAMNLKRILKRMKAECVELTLPKFKIEYKIDLQNVLNRLGMRKMFEDSADFSGIFETDTPMKVSKVLHKAFIGIDEHGCEAAAATSVGIDFRMGFSDCPPSTAHFKADHPFLFHIMDVTKGIVLFSGRYMNPSDN